MKALATAIVEALAFLELSDDDVVDPDSAVEAMESIAATLAEGSAKERNAIAKAVKSALAHEQEGDSDPDAIEFYESFMDSMGLE